jgi:hypothetical protein
VGVGGLQVGVELVDGVDQPVLVEGAGLAHRRVAHAQAPVHFVDVVAQVRDQPRVLGDHVAVGGEVTLAVVLARPEREAQALGRGLGRRQRQRAPGAADGLAAPEAVEVRAVGVQPTHVDVHAVGALGPGVDVARCGDFAELLVLGHLPGDLDRLGRQGLRVVGVGRQSRPDHEAVGRGVAGGHAQLERIVDEHRRRPHPAQGRGGRGGEAGQGRGPEQQRPTGRGQDQRHRETSLKDNGARSLAARRLILHDIGQRLKARPHDGTVTPSRRPPAARGR